MGNRSHLAPWTRDHFPRRVLDVGTGTGDWCFDFAEEFPQTELIIGTDLSNIQPDVGPPNVQFIIDDSSQEWLDDDLDYVHTRDTNGCWENMSAQVIQQAFQKLNPGGWLESQEFDIVLRCDDGTAPADHGLRLWLSELDRISRIAGKPCTITPWLKMWYEEAGFVDVHEEIFRLPTCGWPEDPEEKWIGTWMEEMLNSGIDGILRAYQLRVAGLTMEQHQAALIPVRRDLRNRDYHTYLNLVVVYGRKPDTEASQALGRIPESTEQEEAQS
ncbi:S-adenosyl-L-methionine-dependent methyltransferase [Diaporthe sp. PMI_573]|nr:S-adenosyl-L-methionine-dependent methyltransferase [Diaporthaceae sp. PMI_573]